MPRRLSSAACDVRGEVVCGSVGPEASGRHGCAGGPVDPPNSLGVEAAVHGGHGVTRFRGASVTLVDRDLERAEHTRAEIERAGGHALAVKADVRNEEDCGAAVEAGLQRFGGLDILVNNVGVTGGGQTLETLDLDVWQQTVDVNLKSALLMTRRAMPALVARGGGSVVNIASIAGLLSAGAGFAYGRATSALGLRAVAFVNE